MVITYLNVKLVIFIIRTRRWPFKSKPHPVLTLTSLLVVALAIGLPLTAIGTFFGFVAPPAYFYFVLSGMVVSYLVFVQCAKSIFYKWHATSVDDKKFSTHE